MKILSIFILRRQNFSDHVSLRTDLPDSTWPYEGNLYLNFTCAAGRAEEFCATHWPGVPQEVVGSAT